MSAAENKDTNATSAENEACPFAFSELLIYINETRNSSNDPVVFRIVKLVTLYKQRFQQLMTDIPDVNATRLKDMLVAEIPQMEAYTKGRDVLLAFK